MVEPATKVLPTPEFPRLSRRWAQASVDAYGRVNDDRNLIHYDAAAARRAGFLRPVVHGAIVAALLSEACRECFGAGWFESGQFKVSFIRPVLVDQEVTTAGRLLEAYPAAGAAGKRRLRFEVWCENEAGEQVVVGEASGDRAAP
jgi:acyl dehydratase